MQTENRTGTKNILFTHYGDNWIRGSERCLLDLMTNIDTKKYTPILWCNQPIMAQQARALGIKVFCSHFSILLGWQAPRFNVLNFLRLIKEAKQLITTLHIDIVHANSAVPCQWLNIAARQLHVPLLCQIHAIYPLRDRLTFGLYHVSKVVGVSQYVMRPFYQDNLPVSRRQVIPNGIDDKKLSQQALIDLHHGLNISCGTFVIAAVGSLIKRKGMDLIIDALALLLKKQLPMHLLIIGDGPEKEALTAQIASLGLQQQVTLLGEQDNVMGILRGTVNLFVSGAREEAFGLVFAEASLAGLAIVGPYIGGIPEVVKNNETGLLVSPENSFALSIAIEKLYQSPSLEYRLAKSGQKHILENFTIRHNAQQFEQTYQTLLQTPEVFSPWYTNTSWMTSLVHGCQRFMKRGQHHEA
ncbi:glycosyltransferase family 4 protein [Psychromonas sp. Urea-02u-13]|uniref:glycosyltransferase family 4 protein n=1 Tax=Psychromonas sp. Urea-02u-13 TaxID=2058326 RepID=UPI000C3414C6|nr:glycosyltransferase family 4 protein [Psychromonas sp. Urea-02u-13]PKG37906.1 glycosyltransferase family 1 protein [Psychromonas sp. Urea-02u-13]